MRSSLIRLACLLSALALAGSACGKAKTAPSGPTVAFSSLDLTVGTGDAAVAGKILIVNYTGWLYDSTKADNKGTQFETTVGTGTTFVFKLGANLVIRGWEMGVPGMRVGGTRRLTMPPELAYGSAGAGGGKIPPNAPLIFEIELLEVRDQ